MSESTAVPATLARIVELDLDEPAGLRPPGGPGTVEPDGPVLALVRAAGHPIGLVTATGTPGDPDGLRRALVEAAHRELRVPALPGRAEAPVAAGPARPQPLVSVIVCTRDRTAMLRRSLDSVVRTRYPRAEIIVVDNAPTSDATERLVRSEYGDRIRYLREPVPGLSWARNAGLAAARGEICAFTDDDAIVDAGWVDAVVKAFQADAAVGCVTGLVLAAELETEAQVVLEQYGSSSRGYAPQSWSLRDLRDDPLIQFSVGRFGCGANMAFRTDVVRGFGGFDTATGAGTPARGGEDLLAFMRVLNGGRTVTYQPDAIVWHRHRRTMEALTTQVFNFGVGFGAFLAAAVSREPGLLVSLVRRLPRGVWKWQVARRDHVQSAPTGRSVQRRLGHLEFQGLLCGPFCYAFSLWRQRGLQPGEWP
ncbi:glycosyltransferase [Kitasatospora sp. NPDC057015]|uniref:glycosyltransferase n=1 Tax=Kitasatospora sp. NPDC057015 TaxID=3346001 RepID=UPI00363D80A6